MGSLRFATGVAAAAVALLAGFCADARAARIPVLGPDGVVLRADPGVAARSAERPSGAAAHRRGRSARPRARASARKRLTVAGALMRLRDRGLIDDATYVQRRDAFREAKRFTRRLSGRRRIEMAGVLRILEDLAARRRITVSRIAPLWLTLERNRQWWSRGPLLAPGQRVSFDGSEVVFQYFAGQGLVIHPLANFGKLNALWREIGEDDRLELLLDEMLPLAADRAGGIAWEYYFPYGGGRPPWASAMAQGTALQSIARAARRLERTDEILPRLREGLALFRAAPPSGVRVASDDAPEGAHYLLYSFNPGLRVLNGFMQSLVGLYDFGRLAGDAEATALFADGDAAARAEVPAYDTGAWSLYSRGSVEREASLSYHQLVIGFLRNLCRRTDAAVYCDARARFDAHTRTPPVVTVVTRRLRGGRTGALRFDLSKISRVGVRVSRGDRVLLSAAATLAHGRRSFRWAVPKRRGTYDVRLTAVDLAGNAGAVDATVEVLPPRKKRKRARRD